MKSFSISLAVMFMFGLVTFSSVAQEHKNENKLPFKEYERFHRVLHPLQHESLPKKDYETIRSKTNELLSRGNAVVKMGVPYRTREDSREPFERELANFGRHLKALATNAEEGSDEQVKDSFTAVHDSFEMLVSMLPKSN